MCRLVPMVAVVAPLACLAPPAWAQAPAPTPGDVASEAPPETSAEGEDEQEELGEVDERARVHFKAGQNHYEAGAYEAAIREFEAAYELSGRPLLLYNLYLVYERAGDLEEAASHLERYLSKGDPPNDQRALLETRLDNLRGRLRERRADGQSPGPDASGLATSPSPGSASAGRPPDAQGAGGVPMPAVISFAVGAVGLVTFAVFAGLSEAEDGAVAEECGVDVGAVCDDGEVSRLRAYNIAADVGLGVGLAAATAGVVLWLTLDREDGAVSVGPWSPAAGAGVQARVRF